MPRYVAPKYLTTSDIGQMLQLHVRTVQNWIAQGHLKAFQFGRKYRVLPEDLDAFLTKYKTHEVDGQVNGLYEEAKNK